MDQIKKWTFYLTILVAGFATGIGTIGLFPQMWLKYGMSGMVVHVIFLAILTYLAIIESEAVMKSGYYFTELYTKISRKPGMVMALLTVGIMFLSYYTANVGLTLLSPVLGVGTVARLIAKLIMIGLIFLIITRAKEKTFVIMALGALILVILVPIIAVLFKVQLANPASTAHFKGLLTAWRPLSFGMLREAADRALYGVGLGFGFYIMLGSFMSERFKAKHIISLGVFIQYIIGILSTYAVIYSVAPYNPDLLQRYANGGEEQAIELMGALPKVLSGHPGLLALLALAIFMAGLTSILPASEVDLQIIQSMFKTNRMKAAVYLTLIVLTLGVLDSPPLIADMFLKAVSTSIFITSIFEIYPVLEGRIKPTLLQLSTIVIAATIFLIGFAIQTVYDARLGGIYYLSILLALFVIALGFAGELIKPKPEAS